MTYAPVVLLSCVIGLAFSISPTFLASMSVFIKPLAAEFGWGRTQVSAAGSVSPLALAVCSPLIGPMLDKYGPRRVILVATTLFAAAVASMATLNGNYVTYLLIAALIGTTGTGSNAFAYLSILPNWFDKRYGLSLGVAMIGVGLGQLAAPLYANALVSGYGGGRPARASDRAAGVLAPVAELLPRHGRRVGHHHPPRAAAHRPRPHARQ